MQGIGNALSIAATGLDQAGYRLAVTARNIATATTGDGVPDLVSNVVDLIGERTLYKANALVLKTTDRMLGTLLDVLDTKPGGRT